MALQCSGHRSGPRPFSTPTRCVCAVRLSLERSLQPGDLCPLSRLIRRLQPLSGSVTCTSPPCLTSRPTVHAGPVPLTVPLRCCPVSPSALARSTAGPSHALSPGVSCSSSAVLGPPQAFLVQRVPSGSGSVPGGASCACVLHLRWLAPPLHPGPPAGSSPVTLRRKHWSRSLPCSRLWVPAVFTPVP